LKNQTDSEPVTHLQFVDDNLLMGIHMVREAKAIKNLLDIYKEASRALINLTKSQIYFFNTPVVVQRNIALILGFQWENLPSKYLGGLLLDKSIHNIS